MFDLELLSWPSILIGQLKVRDILVKSIDNVLLVLGQKMCQLFLVSVAFDKRANHENKELFYFAASTSPLPVGSFSDKQPKT